MDDATKRVTRARDIARVDSARRDGTGRARADDDVDWDMAHDDEGGRNEGWVM